MKRPAWAAAPGFNEAWKGVERCCAAKPGHRSFNEAILRMLQRAAVITISHEQAEALPLPHRYAETAAIFANLRLPFGTIFLDFDGLQLGERVCPDERHLRVNGVLLSESFNPDFPLAALAFVEGVPMWVTAPIHRGSELWQQAVSIDPEKLIDSDSHALGSVPTPVTVEIIAEAPTRAVNDSQGIHCDIVQFAIAVLSWLESVNVDLVEMPLRAKARRAALAKGRRIPLVVNVRAPKTRRRQDPSGRHRDFSHRFEVRGHYMHFPEDTKVGGSDPTKLSFVPGRGFVRKVWCPPHVKGPLDKPLVPKVRRVELVA